MKSPREIIWLEETGEIEEDAVEILRNAEQRAHIVSTEPHESHWMTHSRINQGAKKERVSLPVA